MNYLIRLINRRPQHLQTLAVCGMSTKVYGHAVYDASQAGYVFDMAAEDYERDRHDIVGNTQAGQQWVPQFRSGNIFTFKSVTGMEHKLEVTEHGCVVIFDGLRISSGVLDDLHKPSGDNWFRSLGVDEGGCIRMEQMRYPTTHPDQPETPQPQQGDPVNNRSTTTDPTIHQEWAEQMRVAADSPRVREEVARQFLAGLPINCVRAVAKAHQISIKNVGKQKLIDLLVEKMQEPPA